ncbi:MAG TPA: hypothetical protein VF399_05795 [bacterium]
MKLFETLTRIDRRIIFLALGGLIIFSLLFPRFLKVRVFPPVTKLYEAIDKITPDKALILDISYGPQYQAECEPMAYTVLRHAFKNRTKVLALSLYAEYLGLAKKVLDDVIAEYNRNATSRADSLIYGRDYVFLGWQPPPIIPILGMGESIAGVYQVDYYGNQTDTLPLMKHIKNYNNVDILVALGGGTGSEKWWAQFAQRKFGLRVGAGCSAVLGADYYPYYQSGQFTGMMVGVKGAAEYEELASSRANITAERVASERMLSLTYAHLIMIAFIVIGNISYFVTRRKK